ncbi:hypothetical protein ACS0TY_024537 [Phlomoides rotata]
MSCGSHHSLNSSPSSFNSDAAKLCRHGVEAIRLTSMTDDNPYMRFWRCRFYKVKAVGEITFGNLQFLQTLDLSHNSFNGSLPSSLIQCRKLRNLDFNHNNFSASLPDGFGKNLGLLQKLDLSYNAFGGSIPNDLGNLSNFQETVDLSHNKFNGSIPPTLGNLPERVYIDLTYNELIGPIPQNGALINRGPTAFIGNIR